MTQVYSPLAGSVLMAPFALAGWVWPESWSVWLLLLLLGAAGGAGHALLIIAHRHAPAPVLASFVYLNLVFLIPPGYLIFGDLPSAWTLAGASVIIISGLYLLSQERRRAGAG